MPETGPKPDAGPQPNAGPVPKREGAPFDLAMARSIFLLTEKKRAEDPQAYEQAKATYEGKRAEHVAGNVGRMLDERERMAEAEVAVNPRKVGLIEKAWRGWGEVSLIPKSWREAMENTRFGKTRVGRAAIKALNLRTALSLSLLGLAWGSGFGSVVGIGSLIARSGIGMAGTYFGSQAFMEGLAQKHRFTINEGRLKKAVEFDITNADPAALAERGEHMRYLEDELARLEAASLLAGRNVGEAPEYQRMQEAYLRYAETEMEKPDEETHPEVGAEEIARSRVGEIMKRLESQTAERERGYRMGTLGRKGIAAVLAGLFPSVRLLALLGNEKELLEFGRAISAPATAEAAPAGASPGTPSWAQDFAGPDTGVVQRGPEIITPRAPTPEAPGAGMPSVAERTPDATLGGGVKLSPDATAHLQELIGGKTGTAEALAAVEKGLGPTMAIEQGGNVWRSAMRLVETGQMSRPQFEKAWANSYVEIAGQGKVSISKVGLVHAGDIVRFNSEAGVFEVIPKSNIPIGSDKDLFAAYERLGKEAPEWLKKSVGAPVKPQEVLNTLTPETLGKISPAEIDELAEQARVESEGLGLDEAAKVAAGHYGEPAEIEARGLGLDAKAEALVKIERSVEHFNLSNLADQEAMLDALARRVEGDPLAKALFERLQESPAYVENRQAYVRLLDRLIDFDTYAKIRGMTLREVLAQAERPQVVDWESSAGAREPVEITSAGRAMRRLAKLIQEVNPDVAARGMSVDTFLKTAPKRLLELIPDLKF